MQNRLRFSFHKNNFFIGKKTSLKQSQRPSKIADVLCFGLYVVNVFEKSTKAERCTDVIFKLTLYYVTVENLNL